jgi:hypothetical protein
VDFRSSTLMKHLFLLLRYVFTFRTFGSVLSFHPFFLYSFPSPICKVLYWYFGTYPSTHEVFLDLLGAELRSVKSLTLTQIESQEISRLLWHIMFQTFILRNKIKSTASHSLTIVWVLPLSTGIVGSTPSRAMNVGLPSYALPLLFRTCKGLHDR